MNDAENLIIAIAKIGRQHPSSPELTRIDGFTHFFDSANQLIESDLDKRDGACTRREVLTRFLLLNAVLDQGPDIEGVRQLLISVTNRLYGSEVRFIHRPLSFFEEVGLAIEEIMTEHGNIKKIRAASWAKYNATSASKYNLYMDNSTQTLNYAIFRWGVPLALPLVLEKACDNAETRSTALIDYLEKFTSAENMSNGLKDDARFGLGKAIGDKACHLFAKWFVSIFKLCRRSELSWGDFSFEVPYDSNAGRVLWRTGYLLTWADEKKFKIHAVVQPGKGKGGVNYIRVTNIRGLGAQRPLTKEMMNVYTDIAVNHLKSHSRAPKKIEIHRIQHVFLHKNFEKHRLNVANLDDGLIFIGTNYCFNHPKPFCTECPINDLCQGCNKEPRLITDYAT